MSQPNLIYIFADQLRYQSVGYNGDTRARTPNIDAFAKESTIMDNAVSGHPVCAPYRASLLTGKYTTSTGMVINEIRISQNHITFPNVLRANGYETCYIGKWRRHAKAINFGLIYGMSAFGLSRSTGLTPAEASAFVKAYFEQFPKVSALALMTFLQALTFIMTIILRLLITISIPKTRSTTTATSPIARPIWQLNT